MFRNVGKNNINGKGIFWGARAAPPGTPWELLESLLEPLGNALGTLLGALGSPIGALWYLWHPIGNQTEAPRGPK